MEILYHPRSLKFLRKISPKDAKKVADTTSKLNAFPNFNNLDIKKLATTISNYRIRIGNIRAIFEVDSEMKIIYIHDIDFRGNIY